MKCAKKLAGILLALVVLLSLSFTAFAAGEPVPSITINGALKGNTFTVYKIFDLESYDAEANSYAYTINKVDNPLYSAIETMKINEKTVFSLIEKEKDKVYYVQMALDFLNITDADKKILANKLMEAIDGLTEAQKNTLLAEQIVNLGVAAAEGNPNDPNREQKLPANKADYITTTLVSAAEHTYNITFSQLDLGYYVIHSSAGSMVGLTTTNPTATLEAKNELPTVDKTVERNVDRNWDKSNTKPIDETFNYRIKIGVKDGATNYTIYDHISEGLTYGKLTKVYYGYEKNIPASYVIYDATDPTKSNLEEMKANYFEYVTEDVVYKTNDCCFKMTFKDKFLQTVLDNAASGYEKVIIVEYEAKLNEKAKIGADTGNPNDVYMTYGDNNVEVAKDTVTTYTYKMELVKTKANQDTTVIDGAQFEVYKLDGAGNKVRLHFVKGTDTDTGKTAYRVATDAEVKSDETETVGYVEVGDAVIAGLGGNSDTSTGNKGRRYYFRETKAPRGYNLLTSDVEFFIKESNEMATITDGKWVEGGLRIENNSGSMLPATGGIGTTIFYVAGSILLVGAGVLLITKKRMGAAN